MLAKGVSHQFCSSEDIVIFRLEEKLCLKLLPRRTSLHMHGKVCNFRECDIAHDNDCVLIMKKRIQICISYLPFYTPAFLKHLYGLYYEI